MTVTQSPRQDSAGMVSGRVAPVTGGTRGIGAAVGRSLADEGASIAAGYWRGHEGAEKFQAAISEEYRSSAARCTKATSAWPMTAGGWCARSSTRSTRSTCSR
jgi:NAD(P)-dependent dehydrogenase (short-subunit alcohol dehydrogenase family)